MTTAMSPERWGRISALLDEALELAPERRAAFLDGACAGDSDLRRRVGALLEAADRSAPLLDQPALTHAGLLLRQVADEHSERSTEEPADSPGTAGAIGSYRLLHRIGEGGMGEVWLAEQDEPVRRQVALKIVKAGMDGRQVIARFEAERQALAVMDHPAIAKVFDAGATPEGRPFFVMEYVAGEPITTYCDRHRLTTRQRLELFVSLCEGVQHAHQKGIIHRDLKPSNVLVTVQGNRPAPRIIDFGVAKATAQRLTERTMFTELGVMIGTPEYMSPEQAEMTGLDVDTRADVYALGVMLYELLTGALPFDRKQLREVSFDEIRRLIREVEPPRPSTKVRTSGEQSRQAARDRGTDAGRLESRLRGDLDWIVMKALEKDRTRRYAGASELAADIERHLAHEPVLAGPPSPAYRARKFVRRHRLGAAVATAAVLALVAFGGTMAVQARRIARERDRAERVSQFLEELFRVSDPSEARGNTITAREVLDRGAERIERELSGEPETQAQLMGTMGRVYSSLGLYRTAEPLLGRAVEVRRSVLGEEDPATLRATTEVAVVYDRQGRYAEAEELLVRTLETQQRVLGPEHADTLSTRDNLAVVRWGQGRYGEAEAIHRETLEIKRRLLGPEHPDTLKTLNNLANVCYEQNRLDEAEKIYVEVLAVRRRVLGVEHADTLSSMQNLAVVYLHQERLDEAEALHRDALEIKRRVQGPDHPETLRSMNNLANVHFQQGRIDDAERMHREVLESRRRALGPEHPLTLSSMNNVAYLLDALGRHDEAAKLHVETLEARRRVLGPEHPGVLDSLKNLTDALRHDGRYDEAAKVLLETLAIREKQGPPKQTLYDLAAVTALGGRREQALDWLRRSVEAGYAKPDVAEDPAVASLRDAPEFERLVAGARKNAEQSAAAAK